MVQSRPVSHHTVCAQAGRFCGWPANYGMWSWGNEIVTGFWSGALDPHGDFHKRSRRHPMTAMQARSLDGGETWSVIPSPCPTPDGCAFSADEHVEPAFKLRTHLDPEHDLSIGPGLDLRQPDTALLCARTGLEAGAISFYYVSHDRCHTWEGPYRLGDFGLPGIQARTDYVILPDGTWLLGLTAAKQDGREGRIFCAVSRDGGRSFRFRSWIGPEPKGYAIMPATVQIAPDALLCAIRRRDMVGHIDARRDQCWISLWRSSDRGRTWEMLHASLAETGHGGNPPALVNMRDGRLCLTYGYRDAPYGIRARLSTDQGNSWGPEIILRDDGGDGDLGYVRSIQRSDGAMVTVYYHNRDRLGERTVEATVWRP